MEFAFIAWPTLLLIAIGLRMALRLHYGARGPSASDPIYDLVSILSWVLFGMAMLPLLVGSLVTYIGVLFVMLAAVTFVEVITQRREAQRRSICTLLALFIDRRRQLDTSALLSSQTLRGMVGRSARRLFQSLESGASLSQAVALNPRALPRESIAYVAAGETVQAESAALEELSRADHSGLTAIWRACVERLLYLSCVLFVMLGVLTFLMIKIVPAYEQIFYEFDLDLPRMTQFAIEQASGFAEYFAIPTMMCFVMTILGAILVGILYLCDIHVFRGLGDFVFRKRRTADVLRILAVATEQGRPIAGVLSRVAEVYPAAPVRWQLRPAAAGVIAGGVWQDELQNARVVSRTESALLKSAEKTGDLPWTLRQISSRREKRSVYRLNNLLQILYPGTMIVLGGIVAFVCVALFIPLVGLIQNLAR